MGFIDIEVCTGVVTRLRDVADDVDEARTRLRASANAVDLASPRLNGLPASAADLRRYARDLRTRVDLAIAIETARHGGFPGDVSGVVEITDSTGDDLQTELARAMADAAAKVDPEDGAAAAWLAATLEQNRHDPDFASTFLEALGPGEMLDLMARTAAAPRGDAPSDDQATIMTSLRRMMHVADGAWGDQQRAQFADGLVAAATWQDEDTADRGHADMYGAALAYLLANQTYSSGFTLATARSLEEYELSLEESGSPFSAADLWARRITGPNVWAPYADELPDGGVSSISWDPSVAVMSALARDPAAALEFFGEGADGASTTARMQYWLSERSWAGDQFSAISGALAAATTDDVLLQDPANALAIASVTSATVNLIGARDDVDREVLTGRAGPTDAADNFARILAANVLAMDFATRMNSTDVVPGAVQQEIGTWFADGTIDLLPRFSAQSPGGDASQISVLGRFTVLASATDESTQRLRGAVDRYAEVKYAFALGTLESSLRASGTVLTPGQAHVELDPHPYEKFESAWTSQAQLEGMLSHAVGRADIDDAKVDEARRQEWTGYVNDAIGLVPYKNVILGDMPGDLTRRVFEMALGKAQSSAVDGAFSGLTPSAAATAAARSADESSQRAEYQAIMAIVSSGLAAPDLTERLTNSDGTPLSYDDYLQQDAAKSNLLDPGNFGILIPPGGFGSEFDNAFHVYFPQQ